MEPIHTKLIPGGVHIEGFPDATGFIKLDGPKARRLGDPSLHASDLRFALDSLEALEYFGRLRACPRIVVALGDRPFLQMF